MKKIFFSLFSLVIFFSISFVFPIADWTVLNYMQVDNNLYDYALGDLSEMAAIGSNSRVNIIAQIDIPNNVGTWRYRVDKGKLTLDTYLPTEMGRLVDQEIIDCAKWMASKYPAKHYMFILSNHGYGILDPARKAKGILFDDSEGTYLNNQQMAYAFNQIKTTVLGNKKVDIVGMDACLMAMLEVGYQIKDYAGLFVASQETESAYGWFYSGFLDPMSKNYCTPLQAAKYIVSTFDLFYKPQTSEYTQSAVDLNNISLIKQNIDSVISALNECKKLSSSKIKDAIKKARRNSLQFELTDYIDLASFYSALLSQLSTMKSENFELDSDEIKSFRPTSLSRPSTPPNPAYAPRPTLPRPSISPRPSVSTVPPTSVVVNQQTDFGKKVEIAKQALTSGINLINSVVVSNVAGTKLAAAKGLSIYYPKSTIHSSYLKTKFAQESSWVNFIKDNA